MPVVVDSTVINGAAAAAAAPLSLASTHTGCACPTSLRLGYINMPRHVERRAHMEAMLSQVLKPSPRPSTRRTPCASLHAEAIQLTRHEGVTPTCTRGHACRWNQSSAVAWSEHKVYKELEGSATRRFPEARRAGALGAWLAHVSVWQRFADEDITSGNGTPHAAAQPWETALGVGVAAQADLLLLLDDDVQLAPGFLVALPCLLAAVPPELAAWNVIRFSTWGARHEADRVEPSAANTSPSKGPSIPIYHARPHPYDGSGPGAFAYGGVHATLVQRSTIGHFVQYLRHNRAMPIDAALREKATPQAETQVISLVLMTDMVKDMGAAFTTWRDGESKSTSQ